MNDEYLVDLYDWIKRNDGSYEDRYSYKQFASKMKDEAYVESMHSWISDRDPTFRSLEDFNSKIKKKSFDPKNPLAAIVGGSPSEDGSSALPEALKKVLPNRPKPKSFESIVDESIAKDLAEEERLNNTGFRKDLKDQEAAELSGQGKSLSQVYDEYDNFFGDKKEKTNIQSFIESTDVTKNRDQFGNEKLFDLGLGNVSNDTRYRVKDGFWERLVQGDSKYEKVTNASSINALNNRYNKDLSTDVAPIEAKPSVIDPFLSINSDFLSKTEEDAQTVLEKKFGNMGFEFKQAGTFTDYITVTPRNGADPMTFSFDEKSGDEAVRLQAFLRNNASFEKENDANALNIINIVSNIDDPYNSNEYKKAFKDLTYFQQKEEITRRQKESSGFEFSDLSGLTGFAMGLIYDNEENKKKFEASAAKMQKELYDSEEYKLFNSNKSKFEQQVEDRYSLLLDDYEIKQRNGDYEGARQAKLAIESGFSKDVIGDNLTHLSNSQYDVMNAKNNITAKAKKLAEQVVKGLITQEQFDIGAEAIIVEEKKLAVAAESIVTNQKKMNALTGQYVLEKAKYGNFGSNLVNAFVVGTDEVISAANYLRGSADVRNMVGEEAKIGTQSRIITPQQKKYYEDKGYNEEQIKNILYNKAELSSIKANKKAVIEKFGADLTTEESKAKLTFVENALVGVAASLPSMLTALIPVVGQAAAFASMANMSYNAIEEEMLSDPDFETTTKGDRAFIAVPYAAVMGALEKIGLSRMSKGQSAVLGKYILGNIAKAVPKKMGKEALDNIVNKEVKSLVGRGVLKVFAGGLAEAETGGMQTLIADIGMKKAYNSIRAAYTKEDLTELTGGEAFGTPQSFSEGALAVGEGALAEAIGGFAMSTVMVGAQGLATGQISLYNKDDLKFFEDFSSDEEFKKSIVSDLKTKMLEGKMSKRQAQAALNDIDLVAGVFNSIDGSLSEDSKLEAFNLINEKRILEKEVDGKDPALSKKKNDRIAEINQELEELPSRVQEDNLATRAADIQDALRQRKNKSNTIRLDGKKVDRVEAETELQTIITKLDENAIQKQTAGEVLVQPTTTIGEEVVQGEPTAEPQGLTEESQKRKEELELALSQERNDKGTVIVGDEIQIRRAAEIELEKLNALAPVVVAPVTEELSPVTQEVKTEKTNAFIEDERNTLNGTIRAIEFGGNLSAKDESNIKEIKESIELLSSNPIEYVKQKLELTEGIEGIDPEQIRKYREIYDVVNAKLAPVTQELVSEEVIPQAENLTLRERLLSIEAEKAKGKAPVVTAPVVEVKAEAPVVTPAKQGTPTFSWAKIEEYDDAVIRGMMRAQNARLAAIENKTIKASKEDIRAIKAKITAANRILDARANKEKRIEKRTEKGEVTDKSPRVSGFDQNGNRAEFVVVVDKNGQTAKVQLKKRGAQELARQKIESNLKIQTDKKGRFVETQNKSRVYIDDKVTPPKAEVKTPASKAKAKVKTAPVTEVKAEAKAPIVEVKAEPVVEESETEKISRGAEMLKNMSEDERDNFIDDWREDKIPREALPGGARAITLYEAKKLVPNPTSKPKRVTIDNAFSLSMEHSFVINIDGVIYGLNKYEDPDATSDALDKYDEPKQYVWAYTNINEGGEVIETNESNVDELINEIKSSKETKAEPVVEPKAEPVNTTSTNTKADIERKTTKVISSDVTDTQTTETKQKTYQDLLNEKWPDTSGYLSMPLGENKFGELDTKFIKGSGMYEIRPIANGKFEYRIIPNGSTTRMVSNIARFIKPVNSELNASEKGDILVTVKPGILRKEGNGFVVEKKAQLFYADSSTLSNKVETTTTADKYNINERYDSRLAALDTQTTTETKQKTYQDLFNEKWSDASGYLTMALEKGVFKVEESKFVEGRHIYEIRPIGNGQFEYRVVSNQASQNRSYNNVDKFIKLASQELNIPDNTDTIVTVKPGILKRESNKYGDGFVVVKEAEVFYANSNTINNKVETTKKSTVTAEDTMGAINSIKEEIDAINNEIKREKEKARKAVNAIEAKILETKNENQKEELQFDIEEIETQLEEDLEGLKDDLDRQVEMLKEEVDKFQELDAKSPENKKTLLDYLYKAKESLRKLDRLTYTKVDFGISVKTAKLIVEGLIQLVEGGTKVKAAIKEMAAKYKVEGATIENINKYLDLTYVEKQTKQESLQKERDKFVEIREAVRQARVALKSESKVLREKAATTIKDMLKGKVNSISAVKMKSIMTRLASFNVFNQNQYDNFLEYVDKVIEITDYDTKVREANVKRKKAKNNTVGNNPKLGDLSLDLLDSLSRMLNINPKLISKEVFDSYYNIVDDLSKRTTILSPGERTDLNEKVNEIVDSIEQNEEMLPDLKDAYDNYANKVVENKVVNYAKTLTQMLEDGIINNNEFALMKKYKSRIVDAKVKVKMTEQEIADEKAELINEITNTAITLDAIVGDEFRLERELVKRLAKLLNKESLENLDNKQLKDLIKILDNINNGFVSKSTQQMVEILNEKKNASLLETSIPKSVKGIFKKITQPIRGVFTRDKYGVNINPLFNIDEVFGDFKTKNIFNSVLNQSAVSQQQFQSEVAEIQGKLVKAESDISSSFSRNGNEIILSKFKMMVYMMQLEFESNPNSQKGDKKQVNQAMKTLDATIKFAETNTEINRYSKKDIAQMKFIKKEFEKDGEELEEDGKTKKKIIDIDKLYNSFNKAEKNALKVFDEVNSLMTKKATYTATVINGNKIAPLKNYIYYNTISDSTMSNERIDGFMKNTDPNQKKGTESKNLEKRTGEVSPVSLDPFFAVNSSAKSVLVNYHMTEPIRTARKTLSTVRKKLEENKKNNENVGEQFEVLSVIERAYDTATRDLLETNFSESSNIGAIAQYLSKAGYRAMLGSVTRSAAELTSNAAFVTINNPKDMAAGFKYIRIANSGRGKNILTNLKSKVISRNYPAGGLSSNYVDLSAFTDRTVRGGKSKTKYVNGVKQIFDYTAGNWVNAAEFTADFLIATPDKVVMKQLYFGAFSREFKKETGIEPDFEKIEANDEEYMDKYQDALEKATNQADNQTVTAGSSMNAYMGLLQNVVRKGDDGATALFKTFNQFMNRFTIQEYITARKGVKALVGKGDITWEEGVQVLAAVSARMTLYLTLGKMFSEAIMYLGGLAIGYGDDDDEDEKTFLQILYQSAVSSATTLFFGRNFGNVVRSAENYFIERANKEYGEVIGLRNGEYDSFKDALQFNQLGKVDELSDFAAIMAGPLGPVINAGTLGIKLATKEAPSEDRAIETRRKEWYRFGLEAAGSFGLVPFYRDIRKVQMEWVYDELKTELKEDAAKKEIKDEKDANTLERKTNALNRMKSIYKDERSRSIIDDELKKLSDPKFKKQENKKEDDEQKRLLDKYGYDSMTEFEYDDKKKYDKVFGDDSPYRKRMAPTAKIRQELDARILAAKLGKAYKPKVEKKKEEKKSQVPTGPYGDTPYGGSSPYEGSSAYGGSSPYGDNPYGAQTTKKKRFKY